MAKEDSVQQMWESLSQMMQERKHVNAATLANRKALFFLGANAYGIVLNKLAADHKESGDSPEEGGRRIREMFEEVERLTDLAIAEMIPFMGGKTPTEGDRTYGCLPPDPSMIGMTAEELAKRSPSSGD